MPEPTALAAAAILPRVNGVALAEADEALDPRELRQRACTELLRQEAIGAQLLADRDPVPVRGAISPAAAAAIEALLELALHLPEPAEADARRHHAAQPGRYAVGEQIELRHVLFAVTPGVDVNALRARAEACLLELRCADPAGDAFAQAARHLSNCPSGTAAGGELGWLGAADCAPEFAREVFGHTEVGVLPRLVHSRFGLHVVEVRARRPGRVPAFEEVQGAVVTSLRQQGFATALRQYLQLLAGRARIEGVDLDGSGTPLVR